MLDDYNAESSRFPMKYLEWRTFRKHRKYKIHQYYTKLIFIHYRIVKWNYEIYFYN